MSYALTAIVQPPKSVAATRAEYFGDVVLVEYHGSITAVRGLARLIGHDHNNEGRYLLRTPAGSLSRVREASFDLLD